LIKKETKKSRQNNRSALHSQRFATYFAIPRFLLSEGFNFFYNLNFSQ
jgi:hypothetical protein